MMGCFCKHKWKVLDKTLMESPFKRMVGKSKSGRIVNPDKWLLREVFSLVVCCEKCGKLRAFTKYNPYDMRD